MTNPWTRITAIAPMDWLAWYIVNSSGWRYRIAFAVYCRLESRRVHEVLVNDYRQNGYDV